MDPCSDSSAWYKAYGGTGTVTFPNGKLCILSTGTNAAARRDCQLNLNGAKTLKIRFYLDNYTDMYDIQFYFSHDATYVDYLTYSVRYWRLAAGWNEHIIDVNKLVVRGSGSITRDIVSMQIRALANDGKTASVTFDPIFRDESQLGRVIFMFDDGWDSQYTEAYKYLGKYSMPGVIAVIPSRVGTPNYVTMAQLKEIYSHGWDLVNHTQNHLDLVTLDNLEIIEQEISQGESWLNSKGFPRASNIVAYPFGSYDKRVLQAMQSRRAGRVVTDDTVTQPPPDKRLVKIQRADFTATPDKLNGFIDDAANLGGVCLFLFHKIVSGTAVDNLEYNVDYFKQVVDYAYSKRDEIDVITFSEWLDSCGM
ncbi:polysaccharide deacetylase family protein [Bacillus thuringiensis]|nr:polysaccharide deacetylase family protein [Bacillus thuringiensis]